MIIRTAASEQEIEQALEVCWINEHPKDAMDLSDAEEKASALAHWLRMYANSPEGFWVAEDEAAGGKIVGIASAVRHPPQWILTNFYVHPDYHGKGIGRRLLERAYSTREGCERFIVHSSTHPSAQRLYLQLGMYPLPYSIMFKGSPQGGFPPPDLAVEHYPLGEILSTVNALDQGALGFTRAAYHAWWANHGKYYLLKHEDQVIGYFRAGYFRAGSEAMIGPLVVSDAQWMTAALDWAILKQQEISPDAHELFVPGANRAAIAYLLARGYRIQDLNLLLSSHPMPGLAQVVFHDTDLL